MATDTFLGNPPDYVIKWIKAHYQPMSYWEQIVYNLENLPTAAFVSDKTEFTDNELPAPGCALPIEYMTRDGYYDNDGTFVPTLTRYSVMSNIDKIQPVETEWIVLGYNGHVPKYIKYKNGNTYKYVSSTGDETTRTEIVPGATVYERSWDAANLGSKWTATGEIVEEIGTETFTYGQTNSDWGTTAGPVPYSVPMSVNIEGIYYTFCGYTMSLNSKQGLCTSPDGNGIGVNALFDSSTSTDWSMSETRKWLNTTQGATEHNLPGWSLDNSSTIYVANGLKLKLAKSTDLLKHVVPAVNKIWKYDGGIVEDVEDSFFLMSNAEVNCEDENPYTQFITLHDYASALATFDVFKPLTVTEEQNFSRMKTAMSLDGSVLTDNFDWWLRSGGYYSIDGTITPAVGHVMSIVGGEVHAEIPNYARLCGYSPVFVLG